jgi:hypothetical protein
MEITCIRCNQAVNAESCYCPTCGLPQLQYSAENVPGQAPPERWNEPVRDASMVDWKRALPTVLMLAVPAGLLSSGASPTSIFGLLWMSAAAGWAVALYLKSQRPAWITVGAGARIGLVTGLLGGLLAFAGSGGALFVERVVLHQQKQIDADWKTRVDFSQQMNQQWMANLAPANTMQAQASQMQTWMMSPEGHAGVEAFGFAVNSTFLLFFAVSGGALGAWVQARARRRQV